MKNYKLTILLFLINYSPLFSQTPYYDALLLKGNVTKSDTAIILSPNDDVFEVVNMYSSNNNPNQQELMIEFLDNPFLKIDTSGFSTFHDGDIFDENRLPLSSLGGLNVTHFADGLAQFLLDRANEEINVAFFTRLEKFLEKYPEAGILFPTTLDFFEEFSPHEYTTFIPGLRKAFFDDLNSLIYNADDVFLLPKYDKLINDFPEISISIHIMQLIVDLEEGTHPVDVVASFKDLPIWSDRAQAIDTQNKYALRNLHNAFKTTHVLSSSVRYQVEGAFETISIDSVEIYHTIPKDKCSGKPSKDSTVAFVGRVVKVIQNISQGDTIKYQIVETAEPEDACNSGVVVVNRKTVATDTTVIKNYEPQTWVSRRDFKKNIIEDAITFRIFLGLVYQESTKENLYFIREKVVEDDTEFKKGHYIGKNSFLKGEGGTVHEGYKLTANMVVKAKSIIKNDTIRLSTYLAQNKDQLIKLQSLFTELLQKGESVQEALQKIRKSEGKPSREDYYEYINSSIDVIEYGVKLANQIDPDISADSYFKIARSGTDLYRNIYEKQYSAAVLNASTIYSHTLDLVIKSKEQDKKYAKELIRAEKDKTSKSKGSSTAVNDAKAQKKLTKSEIVEIRGKLDVIPEILQYGTFMANIVYAEDPDAVKAAIESAALPVGSSSIKKYYSHNIAINGHLGAFIRTEKKSEIDVEQSWDQRAGLTAPVGISYTPLSLKRGGSLSLFLPVLDVGAIAQLRLSNDDAEIKEEIKLGYIFSPGFFAVYGFAWDLPVSIGFGRQYGPGLFNLGVDDDSNTATPNVLKPEWRWNAFVTVDIPILNIYKGNK